MALAVGQLYLKKAPAEAQVAVPHALLPLLRLKPRHLSRGSGWEPPTCVREDPKIGVKKNFAIFNKKIPGLWLDPPPLGGSPALKKSLLQPASLCLRAVPGQQTVVMKS